MPLLSAVMWKMMQKVADTGWCSNASGSGFCFGDNTVNDVATVDGRSSFFLTVVLKIWFIGVCSTFF